MSGVGRDERAWVRGAQAGSASDLEAPLPRVLAQGVSRRVPRRARRRRRGGHRAGEAFLAAIRSLDRFDRRRPFGPWLHRIVVNRAIDYARRRQLRAESELHEVGAEPPERGDAEGLAGAIARLPPEQRAVIVLRHLLDYTPGEIADLLDLPRGTVNSRLRRGLDALRAEL